MCFNQFFHFSWLVDHLSNTNWSNSSEYFLTLIMATIQVVLIFQFQIQIIHWILDLLLDRDEVLLDFLEFLSLFFWLGLNLIQTFGSLVDKIFQIFLLLLDFINQIFWIFNNVSCLFNLSVKKLAFESLILLLQNSNLTCILIDLFILRWQFGYNDLLLFKIPFRSIEIERQAVFVNDWLVDREELCLILIVITITTSHTLQHLFKTLAHLLAVEAWILGCYCRMNHLVASEHSLGSNIRFKSCNIQTIYFLLGLRKVVLYLINYRYNLNWLLPVLNCHFNVGWGSLRIVETFISIKVLNHLWRLSNSNILSSSSSLSRPFIWIDGVEIVALSISSNPVCFSARACVRAAHAGNTGVRLWVGSAVLLTLSLVWIIHVSFIIIVVNLMLTTNKQKN